MSHPKQEVSIVTEDDIIEYSLSVLFSNLNINEKHFEKDILATTKIEFSPTQIEHLRELIISTNFAKNSVGFGKNGYLYLTAFGITQLKTFGSYRNFLKATQGALLHNVNSNQAVPLTDNLSHTNQNSLTNDGDDMAN